MSVPYKRKKTPAERLALDLTVAERSVIQAANLIVHFEELIEKAEASNDFRLMMLPDLKTSLATARHSHAVKVREVASLKEKVAALDTFFRR